MNATLSSIAKLMLKSRRPSVTDRHPERSLVILANGPSLRTTIADNGALLRAGHGDGCKPVVDTMAVNFAANTPEFADLRPDLYILADPHFFTEGADANVDSLWANLAAATWPMTLYVPATHTAAARRRLAGADVKVEGFNAVGIEGPHALRRFAYTRGLGMPRPRNVLIPAIMVGILAGYRKIYITGADHSWMSTISVTDDNRVVSVQPHYYRDNEREHTRQAQVYGDYRLHQIVYSFYVAFRSYHEIADYARYKGVEIVNATPHSMIDAFGRGPLPEIAHGE